MVALFTRLFKATVLAHPAISLAGFLAAGAVFAAFVPSLKLDASSDALLLKDDPVLRVYDKSRLVFGSDDYVIVAFEAEDVFAPENVRLLAALTRKFRAISGVESVLSLTTERLLLSPPAGGGPLALLAGKPVYLDSPECDLDLAREELCGHEVYSQNLVTPDGRKAAFLIYLMFTYEEKWLEKELYILPDMLAGEKDAAVALDDAVEEFRSVFRHAPDGVGDLLRTLDQELPPDRKGAREALARAADRFAAYRSEHDKAQRQADAGEDPAEGPGRRMEEVGKAMLEAVALGFAGRDDSRAGIYGNKTRVVLERLVGAGRGLARLVRLRKRAGDGAWMTARLARVKDLYTAAVDERRERRLTALAAIRRSLGEVDGNRPFFLAGLPIIFVDMMRYIRSDMIVFGASVAGFLLLLLYLTFRRIRFVVLPMLACLVVVAVVVGLMVLLRIRTTVITSNISSLLLILSMAHSIHLVVHYQENLGVNPSVGRREAIWGSVRHIAVPCFYISATTAVGFLSLLISGILPVIQFGQFMALGVMLAFLATFVVLPAGLQLSGSHAHLGYRPAAGSPFRRLGRFPERRPRTVLALSALAAAAAVVGITGFGPAGLPGLGVETLFVDYFKKETDIRKGLIFIDQKMGGTSSLEVILTGEGKNYFLERENFQKIACVESFFETLPHVGKVISVRSMTQQVGKVLAANGLPAPKAGFPPKLTLGLLTELGGRGGERSALWSYISRDFSRARVFVRLREADPGLNRNEIVRRVREFADGNPRLRGARVDVTGVFVLYANMLNSLIGGQIKTFILVFAAILMMFVVLFRSLRVALVAMVPNLLPIAAVLGLMGYTSVPLDMNNIMIASVTLGIAVDDTIHYLFRYRLEYARDRDPVAAMYRSHASIGRAIIITSVVITAGFSVLAFSNFKPTIYFGVFTAFSMVAALLGALTILPALLILLRPFGRAGTDPAGGEPAAKEGGGGTP
jgi:predicted RND superfamily exporter protein